MFFGAIPSGIYELYQTNQDLIENLVKNKTSRCLNFPGETWNDAAQQIRLICFEALVKFDLKLNTPKVLYGYLAKCVDNRLYNIYRGLYLDNNPPCNRCELWEKTSKTCLVLASGCERIISYKERIKKKRQLYNPQSLGTVFAHDDDDTTPHIFYEDTSNSAWELDMSIRDVLSQELDGDDLLYYYDKLKNGDSIPKSKQKRLQELLKDFR